MSKYVKVEDVIELINGLDSLPWEEETGEMVNRLPAYDLDKVVERLEEERQKALIFSHTEGNMRKAIDIVRGGGVNE